MRVLLLHPEDDVEGAWSRERWDLIVDLGRAPKSSYEEWSCGLGCRIFSIFDLAIEVEDLRVWRGLLALGMGRVVDRWGIDWWDVFGLLLQAVREHAADTRLAEELRQCRTLAVTRSSVMADALQLQLGIPLTVLRSGLGCESRTVSTRYGAGLANLSFEQLRQVAYDKFDSQYAWRRKFARAPEQKSEPVILLPTAYSNVTKTALQYAQHLPEQRFLLVLARESGAASNLPANVRMCPWQRLHASPPCGAKCNSWQTAGFRLEQHLQELVEFRLAAESGYSETGTELATLGTECARCLEAGICDECHRRLSERGRFEPVYANSAFWWRASKECLLSHAITERSTAGWHLRLSAFRPT